MPCVVVDERGTFLLGSRDFRPLQGSGHFGLREVGRREGGLRIRGLRGNTRGARRSGSGRGVLFAMFRFVWDWDWDIFIAITCFEVAFKMCRRLGT